MGHYDQQYSRHDLAYFERLKKRRLAILDAVTDLRQLLENGNGAIPERFDHNLEDFENWLKEKTK